MLKKIKEIEIVKKKLYKSESHNDNSKMIKIWRKGKATYNDGFTVKKVLVTVMMKVKKNYPNLKDIYV